MSLALKKRALINYVQSGGGTPSRLPTGYQEVEYIETSGSQYIDTGVTYDNGYTLKAKISPTNTITSSTDMVLTGCRLSNDWSGNSSANYNYKAEFFGFSGTNYQIAYDTQWLKTACPTTANAIYEIESFLNAGTQYLKVNGSVVISNTISSMTYLSIMQQCHLLIFARCGENAYPTYANHFFTGRLYSYSLELNGTLVRNFVPCYRTLDNEIGLYDLVNDVFYANAGSGSFSKGADVN